MAALDLLFLINNFFVLRAVLDTKKMASGTWHLKKVPEQFLAAAFHTPGCPKKTKASK